MSFDVVDDTYENFNIDQSLNIENEFIAMNLKNMINNVNEFIEQFVKKLSADKTLDLSEFIISIVVKNTNVDETLSLFTVELFSNDLSILASSANNVSIIELSVIELSVIELPVIEFSVIESLVIESLVIESLVIKSLMSTVSRTARKASMSSVNLVKKASNKRASKS
jgi:hypothetical protein